MNKPALPPLPRGAVRIFALLLALILTSAASGSTYDLEYRAGIEARTGIARVTIELRGETLPSRMVFHLDPDRHLDLRGDPELEFDGDRATWHPRAPLARLSYRFVINEKKTSGRYDSYITDDWSIMRSDELIPPIAVKAPRNLESRAWLDFELPEDWSMAAPYELDGKHRYRLVDPGRGLIRPKGWLILGRIAARSDTIAGVETRVAAPRDQDIRLQDTLAFLNWTLPEVTAIFPDFPQQLLVVSAVEPMWLGGLSGTRSLFMHGSRPLVSGNRTSSLIHELVHVATGIHGDEESDWIVEGLAEFYSVNLLYRAGGISERRYRETLEELQEWGREANSLLVERSSGAITARAVGVLERLDRQIRTASDGEASLDDVARELAADRGRVTLERLTTLASQIAGVEISGLERDTLSRPAR